MNLKSTESKTMNLILKPEPTHEYLQYLFSEKMDKEKAFTGNLLEREAIFIELLKSGLYPNQEGSVFKPLLMIQSPKMTLKMLQAMMDAGLDVNQIDNTGSNVLHRIVSNFNFLICDVEKVDLLFQYGIDVNHQDKQGNTPLHLASMYGCLEWINWLIVHDADPFIVNHKKKNIEEIACTGMLPSPWTIKAKPEEVKETIVLAQKKQLEKKLPQPIMTTKTIIRL